MRMFSTLAILAAAAMPVAVSVPTTASAQAAAHYTTADTSITTLLGDPAAKAVLMKIIPEIAGNEGISQAGSMTLKQIQEYAPDRITAKNLADIDAELAKLPAK